MTMPLINCRREMKRWHSLLKKVSSFMHVWRNAGLKSCMNTATKHIPEKITSKLSNCYESVSWGKKVYDISNKKESIFSSTSGNSSSKEQGSNQPLLNINSSNILVYECYYSMSMIGRGNLISIMMVFQTMESIWKILRPVVSAHIQIRYDNRKTEPRCLRILT